MVEHNEAELISKATEDLQSKVDRLKIEVQSLLAENALLKKQLARALWQSPDADFDW